jgi:hypothetical protein
MFDVMVRSRDDAAFLAVVRGYYVEKPLLPPWAGAPLAQPLRRRRSAGAAVDAILR